MGGARCDAGHTFEGRTNLRPKSGRVVRWRDGLGLYVRPRKEKEGEGGGGRGSASSAEPAEGGILVIRIDEPGSAAPGPCGRRGDVQVVNESHRSPGEVEPGDRGDSGRDLED